MPPDGLIARSAFAVLLALCAVITLTFLALPLVALVAEAPLADVPDLLRDPAVRDILAVTARTNLVANALILGFGTPTAYLLATRRFPGRALLVTLVELPLVLPPAVAGIGLLAAFGAGGLFGDELQQAGIVMPFSEWAVVLAITFVASPFYVRQAIASFEGVDPLLPDGVAHARRRSRPDVLARLPAPRGRRARRRLGARLRARDRRVRRDDRVRRQRAR